MYSTCLFCRADLGRNELIEPLPVGRRIAVDPARGRLWVICGVCKRWNLSPLEERWEALEAAERLVEKLRPEAMSDQIALFTHPGGLRIVRVGSAKWRELAHTRYGARLQWRRTKAEARKMATQVVVQIVPRVFGGAILSALGPVGVAAGIVAVGGSMRLARRVSLQRPVARIDGDDGAPIVIRGKHLKSALIIPSGADDRFSLSIDSDLGPVELHDADALRVTGRALVHFNPNGAGREDLAESVKRIEEAGSTEKYVASVMQGVAIRRAKQERGGKVYSAEDFAGRIWKIADSRRIALEIAAHEQIEDRALEGELAVLDRMWKEAEEIAAIADNLLVPQFVSDSLRRLRGN